MTREGGGRTKRRRYGARSASPVERGRVALAVGPGGGSAVRLSATAVRTRTLVMLFGELQALVSLKKKKKKDEKVN